MNAKVLVSYLFAASLLGGCASMGDVLSGNKAPAPGNPAPADVSEVRGTIQSVDPQLRTITMSADSTYQSNLRGADRVVIAYDSSTTVNYQGRQYAPQDLESGDRIDAHVQRQGNQLFARSIDVVASVSGGASPSTGNLRDFDATVRNVDVRNRTLELAPADGRPATFLEYDSSTRVDYQGRSYRPEDLERGDQVHVSTRTWNGHALADTISVTRSMSGDNSAPGAGQVRGTVRYIDTQAHTIELGGASWAQGFNPAPGGNSVVVTYDAGTVVEYQGRRYGIANLEPGDVVDIEVSDRNGTRPVARRIVVAKAS